MFILKKESVSKFKNWAKSDKKFKQYVNYFTKNNMDIMEPFFEEFIEIMNEKLERKSLPKITI